MNLLNFSLLPARCVLCQGAGLPELDLCDACLSAMPAQTPPMPYPYGTVHAGFRYQTPIDEMIQGFKFNEQLHLGRLAARLALPALSDVRPDALVPVPLHARRLRERGFNQSLELAEFWGSRFALPVLGHALQRHRATRVQSSLKAAERLLNVSGAFSVKGALPGHVALVDDVYTTGATCQAAAQALLPAGVRRVDVWCLARVD
ncbi:MAG TPA: ComF family protein [Arenimonas sp.]|nr:ComF family protein [Arenimonas sp.]